MNKYTDSYEYDTITEGIIDNVDIGLGPRVYVTIREESGYTEWEDLPTPEDMDYEDFWSQFIGHRVRVEDKRRFKIEVLPKED